jgi:glycolate oxidase subunit GlcD
LDSLIKNLRALLSDSQVLSEADELLVYECDGLTHYRARPRAVVFPHSTEETAAVVGLLAREKVPFAPRGAGTGLSGGALALAGGVCVETARMRKVLRVDAENRLAVVEAGVVNAQVSRAAARHGLHYAPDPSSQASCTVGGNIAENAGGIHCLKYGVTVDHVLSARVVLSDGSVVTLDAGVGGGLDLLGVFVGSEGTFGVVTEATVRLTPVAPAVRTLLADFTDINDASRAVSAVIAEGVIPAALEMVDGATIRAVEQSVFAAGLPTDAEAALLVELDGLEAGMDAEVARVERVCREAGARGVRLAADEAERKRFWAARKGAFGAMGRISPDLMLQDAVVPRSRLPEVLAEVNRIGAKYRLRLANVFHAGDGNLHPVISYDGRDRSEVARVKEAGREIVETCVRAGGTITGEHGVGIDKSEYLPLVFTDEALRAMLEVRAAFDPSGLCNPGKIIPAPKGCGEARAVGEAKGEGRKAKGESEEAFLSVGGEREWPASGGRAAGDSPILAPAIAGPAKRPAGQIFFFDSADILTALARVVGEQNVSDRRGAGGGLVVAPATAEEVRGALAEASQRDWVVAPAGTGSGADDEALARTGRGATAGRVTLLTERMSRLLEHEPADLVATAEAGMTLGEFNQRVGRAGQWLALDAPGGEASTLGGLVARGLGGAQELGYGPPRRHVLGMTVALADGRVVRLGGRVVKNVAGYDLCKLFVGSRGALGVILDLTFRLRPRPERERTLVVRAADWRALLAAAREVISTPLFPVAAEVFSPALARALGLNAGGGLHALLLRFAGVSETVDYQLARASELVRAAGAGLVVEALDDDAEVWRALAASEFSRGARLVWRARTPPDGLDHLLSEMSGGAGDGGGLLWHAGAGDGRLRVCEARLSDQASAAAELKSLRGAARECGGALVVERAPEELSGAVSRLDLSDGTAALARRVKSALDPCGLFGPFGGDAID